MSNIGRVNHFGTNLLAFACVTAALLATGCDSATEPNEAPEALGSVEELAVDIGKSESLNIGSDFSDPNGDVLTFSAESSNTAVATVSVSGSTVILTGVSVGSTTVTVTATDPGGLSVSVNISVEVTSFLGACTVGMELDPGDACSVGSSRFTVLADGWGSFGCCFTAGQGIHINRFSASRIQGTDRWRINSVP